MIDINKLRAEPEKLKTGTQAKGIDSVVVEEALEADKKWRELTGKVEKLRAERNTINQELKNQRTEELKNKSVQLKRELKDLEPRLRETEEKLDEVLRQIPNPAANDVKVGKDERENEIIRKWGEPKKFPFAIEDHLVLGESLGIIDVERAGKVSGSRFGYFKGAAVQLEFALVQLAMKTLVEERFVPILTPVLIKKEMMGGMGYLEHSGEDDMYVLDKDGLVLVGTSEQSIGPMHAGEVLSANDLPIRYMGFSTCFRREAGSYGKDTRGILRVHQFDKVEMFSFAAPEKSDDEHEFLLNLEEEFFKALKIPYQVVKMCTGDLGVPAARKYDIEAWMPGQGKYREVTSTSTTTDFQARRLNIRYRDKGEMKFVHMLNGTAFAMGRTIIAILENYQQKDGSVVVPEVLQKYMGMKVIKRK